MPIPTIPGTQQVQSPTLGVRSDPRGRIQALQGVKQVIQATEGAFDQAAQGIISYEQKKQKAEEVAAFNQASIVMRESTATYREHIAHNPDYNSYVPEWQKQSQAVRQQILAYPNLSGPAKRQMSQMLDSWQSQTHSEFQEAADLRGTTSRRTIATLAAEKAYRDGNLPAGDAAIDGAVRVGDMWPEAGMQLKQSGKSTAELAQIETGIRTDPARLMDDIAAGRFKSVTAHQLETANIQARAQVARNQSDALQALYEELATDPTQMTDERLEAQVKLKVITQTGANRLKLARDMAGRKEARDNYNVLMMQVHDYDFTADKVPEEQAQHFREVAAALPTEYARPAMNAIASRLNLAKKSATQAEKPVESHVYAQMKKDFEEGFTLPGKQAMEDVPGSGFFGFGKKKRETGIEPQDENMRYQWQAKASPKERDAATLHYARMLEQMRGWFSEHPNATDTEAEEFRQKISQPYVIDAVKRSLAPAASGSATPPARPPGAAFYSKSTGKWYDKDKKVIE